VGYLAVPQVVRAGINSQAARTHVLLRRPTPSAAQPRTLEWAWQAALQQGRAWSPDAVVVSLVSRDLATGGVSTELGSAGSSGGRAVWEATLVAPSKPSQQLRVRLANGAVVGAVAEPRVSDAPPVARAPALDSASALAAARAAQPLLAPTDGKSHGYEFMAGTGQDRRATLAVVGSSRGMRAKVDFDAVSGKLVGASVYAFTSGGVIYSADAGQTWWASSLTGRQVQQVAEVPGQPDVAYAAAMARGALVSRTGDGGRSWRDVGRLPDEAGLWVTGMAVVPQAGGSPMLAVGMLSGLWLSKDGGATWAHNTALPSGTVQWMAAAGRELLASVSNFGAPENEGVYGSADFQHWRRVLPDTLRLCAMDGGQAAVALHVNGATTADQIAGTATAPLTFPIRAIRVAGTIAPGRPLLADDTTQVALSVDGGRSWATTLRTATADIAVGPTGTGSEVAIAGGFRTGVFRSADGGRTWQQVVSRASSILPGSDEVGSLAFEAPGHVIATQGGNQTWQSL